jgi:signal recognition particle GTPase
MPKAYTFNDLCRNLRCVLQNGSPVLKATDYRLIRNMVAIIESLTEEERERPNLLLDSPSRWSRAVSGSGVTSVSSESLRQLLSQMGGFANHLDR